jgi:CRP-like cAMP-binding protein
VQEKLRRHIEAIIPLTDEEYSSIISLFSIKKIKKNQFLIKQGETVKEAYYVLSGLLKLTFTDDSGKLHIVSFAMEDWWESDFQAYFTQSKATLSLQCLEDTEVLCLPIEGYEKMCFEIPKMQVFLVKLSNAGFIASQQRILSLLTSNAKERYDQLLYKYPSLFQRVPKSQLALYLGVSRETLSRFSS